MVYEMGEVFAHQVDLSEWPISSSSSKEVVKFLKTAHLLKSCGCGELHLHDPFT